MKYCTVAGNTLVTPPYPSLKDWELWKENKQGKTSWTGELEDYIPAPPNCAKKQQIFVIFLMSGLLNALEKSAALQFTHKIVFPLSLIYHYMYE